MKARLEYVAAGGNRHPAAADWAPGLVAFGASNNIALWDPNAAEQNGVSALLSGHTDVVNAIKILDLPSERLLLSGGADRTVRLWAPTNDDQYPYYVRKQCLSHHKGSVNTIACLPSERIFASGAADGSIAIWKIDDTVSAELTQSTTLKPRYLPLTIALAPLSDGLIVLAVAGTSSVIQLYVRPAKEVSFELQATLTGHEGWIRSLDFATASANDQDDLLLASASQDKYIRLWRFRRTESPSKSAGSGTNGVAKKSLSNKAHKVGSLACKYVVTFEALLVGHEDWIYTAKWAPNQDAKPGPTLLSASADNSLAIWTVDEGSGVWICNARLGEISTLKGSTTATGSAGGFWIGLWQPSGKSVISLGRTGSWRRWSYDSTRDTWVQQVGISGHTQEVRSVAWAADGSYLLTTGSDQTTRLFAEWKRGGRSSWHECARPQIHGYDLNCIDTLTPDQFISGADEKLLRVFNKPRDVDRLLARMAGVEAAVDSDLPDAANIPVLGLSNKAIAVEPSDEPANGVTDGDANDGNAVNGASGLRKSMLDLEHPPFEDHLARHTLWPEHEKLYGHGYEISAVAASHDHTLVATACKASAIEHAVIRIYETTEWREVKPPLTAHSLTIGSLAFSRDDSCLLSVGRDRQWAVFERDGHVSSMYKLLTSNPKGHARMILDCSWAPITAGNVFATVGRDKAVKIWRMSSGQAECVTTLTALSSVTAVAFSPTAHADGITLAYGTEDGSIGLATFHATALALITSSTLDVSLCPSKAVTAIRWRPGAGLAKLLAVASGDSSVRILEVMDKALVP